MGGYIGARAGSLSTTTVANVQDVTATDTTPEVTIVNNTHEDTDGGREGKVIFKGQQSGGEESTLAEIQASHDGTADDEKGDLIFRTNDGSDGSSPTEAMRITSQQRVGILTNDPSHALDVTQTGATSARVGGTGGSGANDGTIIINSGGTGDAMLRFDYETNTDRARIGTSTSSQQLEFYTAGDNERMRILSDGVVLVGRTAEGDSNVGNTFRPDGFTQSTRSGSLCGDMNRLSSAGDVLRFQKDGTVCGAIGVTTGSYGYLHLGNADCGLRFTNAFDEITPFDPLNLSSRDNALDLGSSGNRFDDIYATNGSIVTSDENEKQNIASLTSAEITAATAISKLFKTFKWKDRVTEKGDAARTHTGVIAQQVETAMSDAGLDAGDYAFFISTTWWETQTEVAAVEADDTVNPPIEARDAYTRTEQYHTKEEAPEGATERNRKGIRYPELLSFIGAATEQRLTSIEARLDALEAE